MGVVIGLLLGLAVFVWTYPVRRLQMGPFGDVLEIFQAWWTLNVQQRGATIWVESIAGVQIIAPEAAAALAGWGLRQIGFRELLMLVHDGGQVLDM